MIWQNASRFFTMLSQATENDCDFAFVDESITIEQINDYKESTKDSDLLIFGPILQSSCLSSFNNDFRQYFKCNQ